MKTTQQFIDEARSIHGDLYDYSGSIYNGANVVVEIKCGIHGVFLQRPSAHLAQKQGCPKCGLMNRKNGNKTTQQFVEEATAKWGNRYDYSKTEYKNKKTKITYRCKTHGSIDQLPNLHIKSGCPLCAGRGVSKHTLDSFIQKAREIHQDAYDYSLVEFDSIHDKIIVICPQHGRFSQKASNHINSRNGCPKCNGGVSINTAQYIKKAEEKHKGRFNYSLADYTKSHEPITVICPDHGRFTPTAYTHLQSSHSCPQCVYSLTSSQTEDEIEKFISSNYSGDVLTNDRKALRGKEIDIFIPDKRLGFEFNGSYWHCDKYVDRNYHLNKTRQAESIGLQLVQIFDYEWQHKRRIVESRIKSLLGANQRIFARNTKVVELSQRDKNQFLERTHIQGRDNASICYGLTKDNRIVACMTFGKPRYDKKREYELIRYSSEIDLNVVGGASKLLAAFRKQYSGSIVSYADRRWSIGNLYSSLGFAFDGFTPPGFVYYQTTTKKVFSRISLQKHRLKNMPNYDPAMTAEEILSLNNFRKIWNSGNSRWVHH